MCVHRALHLTIVYFSLALIQSHCLFPNTPRTNRLRRLSHSVRTACASTAAVGLLRACVAVRGFSASRRGPRKRPTDGSGSGSGSAHGNRSHQAAQKGASAPRTQRPMNFDDENERSDANTQFDVDEDEDGEVEEKKPTGRGARCMRIYQFPNKILFAFHSFNSDFECACPCRHRFASEHYTAARCRNGSPDFAARHSHWCVVHGMIRN
jgi:hypothetical protein